MLSALNVACHVAGKRSLLAFNAIALTFTLGMILGLMAALIAIVGVPAMLAFVGLGAVTETLVRLGRWPLIGALLMAGLAVLYRYGPRHARPRLRWVSLGAVIVVMLWLYISVLVIILGAKLDAEIEHETSIDTTTGPLLPMGQRGAFVADRVAPHE